MLIDNIRGNYSFIRGIGPFSAAVRANPGFEIVHARLHPFQPLAPAYGTVESHLRDLGRPINALCGMHLRIPRPLSRQGFEEFNRPYIERLRSWALEVNGANPVTRTNVALEINAVDEPALAGFFYTAAASHNRPGWVISGVPEIETRDGAAKIVAPGDISLEGLRRKAECVLQVLTRNLSELGSSWDEATAINLYTVHDLYEVMTSTVLPAIGTASRAGITWHCSRPPVEGLELEIDASALYRVI
jgi:hypothetical protein